LHCPDLKPNCLWSSSPPAGLLFFRHGKNTTHFIDAWQAKLDADDKVGWG
jgi:hypothetical protein